MLEDSSKFVNRKLHRIVGLYKGICLCGKISLTYRTYPTSSTGERQGRYCSC